MTDEEARMQLAQATGAVRALAEAAASLMETYEPTRSDMETATFLLSRAASVAEKAERLVRQR